MKDTLTMPKGFKEATGESRKRINERSVNGSNIILEEGEIITPRVILSSNEPVYTNPTTGEKHYSLRILCESDRKGQRLLTIGHFNPYPKNRYEFLDQTDFGKFVKDYSGSVGEMLDELIGKKLVVQKIDNLVYTHTNFSTGAQSDREGKFHRFEFVK